MATDLSQVRVLDGGMASELEFLGADITGPLWSAHVLEDAPEKVVAVHHAYLEAGTDCLLTASYQVSRQGYREFGLSEARADAALLRSVELARQAAAKFSRRHVVIAASLGPYGAALHNGSEYHGNYGVLYADLVDFHRQRIAVLAAGPREATPDLLAFETIPSLEEARAIGEALAPFPKLSAWLSFTCRDGERVAHGELISECGALADGLAQTVAIGVNCTQPVLIPYLIAELQAVTTKPIMVYPNSGEGWDAHARHWTGTTDAARFGELAGEWYAAGAQMVGGCCRTRPEHVRFIAEAAKGTVPAKAPEQH